MKCIICAKEYKSHPQDYFCSGSCINIFNESGKSLKEYTDSKKLEKELEFREAQWQDILKDPSKYDRMSIVAVMNWFNARDSKKEQEDWKKYIDTIKEFLVDSETSLF